MSLSITSLNSGSNGNCYYVGNENEAILVDAGISCRETEKRMKRLGLCIEKVKGIFVSHEHSDHINGIAVLARKYQLPVYITPDTLKHGRLLLDQHLTFSFRAYNAIHIGGLAVTAFPKFHDACDPHSFIVASTSVTVGIFTDIGFACEHVIRQFRQCHAAFLEANYDEEMLNNGRYPYYLKQRIKGGKGHLSNAQALQLVTAYRPPFMSHLLLSHLSANNNCPDLVKGLFSRHAGSMEVIIASRKTETPVYRVSGSEIVQSPRVKYLEAQQLSLF